MSKKRMKEQSQAQKARQRERSSENGRYIKNPCHGCGKGAPIDGYFSHPLTDSTGADGEGWGDAALVLCPKCADATLEMVNVSEFKAYAKKKGGKK